MTTAGMFSGSAPMANATAAWKIAVNVSPRARLMTTDTSSASPAIRKICRVRWSSCRVSGVLDSVVDCSIPEMWPTSVFIPVVTTTNTPEPRVTLVFMNTMSLRSPKRGVRLVDRGRPLGHRQALAGERGLGDLEGRRVEQPPVGRDDVAGLDRDDVPGHQLLGRQLGQLPVPGDSSLDDHHLLQGRHRFGGLALLTQAEHRVEHGQ